MSTWEEKFNDLQSQHESILNQNESMKKELEQFKRDQTTTTAQMYHGMLHIKIIPPLTNS